MWIASKLGFFSIVLKEGQHHIRARKKEDLSALINAHPRSDEFEIEEWPSADYRYRIRIPEGISSYKELMDLLIASIDYPNFKSEIAANSAQRHKLNAYHKIWAIMADLQE